MFSWKMVYTVAASVGVPPVKYDNIVISTLQKQTEYR